MGAKNSKHPSGAPKADKDCMKRKVFTAGFDMMGTEANVQIGYKSHTLKRYSPSINTGNGNLHGISGGSSSAIIHGVGATGREDVTDTDTTAAATGSAEARR
jgi:hypothetical protein